MTDYTSEENLRHKNHRAQRTFLCQQSSPVTASNCFKSSLFFCVLLECSFTVRLGNLPLHYHISTLYYFKQPEDILVKRALLCMSVLRITNAFSSLSLRKNFACSISESQRSCIKLCHSELFSSSKIKTHTHKNKPHPPSAMISFIEYVTSFLIFHSVRANYR